MVELGRQVFRLQQLMGKAGESAAHAKVAFPRQPGVVDLDAQTARAAVVLRKEQHQRRRLHLGRRIEHQRHAFEAQIERLPPAAMNPVGRAVDQGGHRHEGLAQAMARLAAPQLPVLRDVRNRVAARLQDDIVEGVRALARHHRMLYSLH